MRTSSTQGTSGQREITPFTGTLVEFLTGPYVEGLEPLLGDEGDDVALGQRIIAFVRSDENQFNEKLELFTQLVLDALDLVGERDTEVLGTLMRLSRDALDPESVPLHARPEEPVWEQVRLAVANHKAVLSMEDGHYVLHVVVAQIWSGHTFLLAEIDYDQHLGFFGKPPRQALEASGE
jgi:hypothetical protein